MVVFGTMISVGAAVLVLRGLLKESWEDSLTRQRATIPESSHRTANTVPNHALLLAYGIGIAVVGVFIMYALSNFR